MRPTTPEAPNMAAVRRNLLSLAAPDGGISMLALDHRDAMRNVYRCAGIYGVDEKAMVAAKVRIVEALDGSCSSILLDLAALAHCRRPGLDVMVPLEEQGHDDLDGGRLNPLLGDFGPADAARFGAQACKLLLYYRADHRATATRQRELVERAAADCHRHGLPLIVEPKVYRLDGESDEQFAASFGDLVVAAAGELSDTGADLLKVEYPGDAAACERVGEAAAPLGWTLLGGSDSDGDTFAERLLIACGAGASGFIAGRAIWGGALAEPEDAQSDWLSENALPTFERLVDITESNARRLT